MWPLKKENAGSPDNLAGLLPEEVVELLEKGEDVPPRSREAAILFVDLGGFVRFAEGIEPEQVAAFLSAFEGALEGAVRKNKGMVVRFTGDGLMALWLGSKGLRPAQTGACLAALDCLEAVEELGRSAGLTTTLPLRAGLSAGKAAVGFLQAGRRRHFTAVGDEVNVASRLVGANKLFGTKVLASLAAFQPASDSVAGRPIGRVRVAGRETPIEVLEPLGRKDILDDKWKGALPLYLKGLDLFRTRKFAQAAPVFHQVLGLIPGDGPSRLYASSAEEFSKSPPPEGWDGVFNLSSK